MNSKAIKPVSLTRRLVIMFYDAILLVALLFFASILVAVPFEIAYDGNISTEYILYILYIYLVAFIFLGWCWTHGGQTLGSKTWSVKLISDLSQQVTWSQSLLRYIGSLLCWASLGIGFLWCYTNTERLAWNDMLSKTRLVKVNEQT